MNEKLQCNKCDELKPKSEFYECKNSSTGYLGCCKKCHKARMKELYWENPEWHRQRKKTAYWKNPLLSRARLRERYNRGEKLEKKLEKDLMKYQTQHPLTEEEIAWADELAREYKIGPYAANPAPPVPPAPNHPTRDSSRKSGDVPPPPVADDPGWTSSAKEYARKPGVRYYDSMTGKTVPSPPAPSEAPGWSEGQKDLQAYWADDVTHTDIEQARKLAGAPVHPLISGMYRLIEWSRMIGDGVLNILMFWRW